MEEKKLKKTETKKDEKLTYEQLEQIANNLNNKCRELYENLQEAKSIIANVNDVGMLLSILDKSDYFDVKFVDRCASKVESVVSAMLDKSEAEKEEN